MRITKLVFPMFALCFTLSVTASDEPKPPARQPDKAAPTSFGLHSSSFLQSPLCHQD
jgi:hypothetical protein